LKALKEYQRLKQREHEQSKILLQKQQQELEHMRLRCTIVEVHQMTCSHVNVYSFRYLAAEESEIMKGDHKQLENIKNELNK
jgi:uncharacterized protein (DUF342 family)